MNAGTLVFQKRESTAWKMHLTKMPMSMNRIGNLGNVSESVGITFTFLFNKKHFAKPNIVLGMMICVVF